VKFDSTIDAPRVLKTASDNWLARWGVAFRYVGPQHASSALSSSTPPLRSLNDFTSVPCEIAVQARGSDVRLHVGTTVASGDEVLRGTFATLGMLQRQTVFTGECRAVVLPHRLIAVTALANLLYECIGSKALEQFSVHGRPRCWSIGVASRSSPWGIIQAPSGITVRARHRSHVRNGSSQSITDRARLSQPSST
jgi:hypothetical protein